MTINNAGEYLQMNLKKELTVRGAFEIYYLVIDLWVQEELKELPLKMIFAYCKDSFKDSAIVSRVDLDFGVVHFIFNNIPITSLVDITDFVDYFENHMDIFAEVLNYEYQYDVVPDEDGN